ncbi:MULTISPECIES: hypothetical protein [Phaeobacter]|uniref:Uncharacterized protein n=1 Tax=Phaeobacter inhibens TaxID=221822 RepID=A0ABM6RLU9_9RHOB|nr:MULTISPECIES: hypothetical protein [Phaeobacter]AUQ93837.1 hypothetical protein PhaeoP66_01033 [Phaeobacter inhibens]AUQ97365.1 hypothetical protein PhaeoP66_04639 [Phaeobacter inhibens]AXT33779.1 hypothetical protein D1820_01680 [Phaeobacter sp. LSS9]UWR40225.1 hypothetical protein K4F85_12330 [Phaeobacter inhibens]UWR73143.1 hypothetical protein K4L00_03280 [Phaeobacter inhibens]
MTLTTPPALMKAEPHDPYKMRSLEQVLSLFDGGDFLIQLMKDHRQLQLDMLEHKEEHGTKGCQGSMTITVSYAVGKSGDVNMGATAAFKGPKKPASNAAAFLNDQGELTLYSPMMKQMHEPVRDVTDYDPETGEIRDPD